MSWSRRGALLALAAAMMGGVAGCGFQPLYRQGNGARAAPGLAAVHIRPDPNRNFQPAEQRLLQMVSNELIDRMQSKPESAALYDLVMDIVESRGAVLVTRTEAVSRFNLSLSSSWRLIDRRSGAILLSNSNVALASYNVLRQEYSNLAAENDARERATRDLAEQIRARLGLYFERAG
jgi:LPS-assembly lipoprotein